METRCYDGSMTKKHSIIVYTKTGCPWSIEVMDFLELNEIAFEERNLTLDPAYRKEVMEKTGQSSCPTLDIDGYMLPNSDAEAVESYLRKIKVL